MMSGSNEQRDRNIDIAYTRPVRVCTSVLMPPKRCGRCVRANDGDSFQDSWAGVRPIFASFWARAACRSCFESRSLRGIMVSSAGHVGKRVSGMPEVREQYEASGSGVRERGMYGRSSGTVSERVL